MKDSEDYALIYYYCSLPVSRNSNNAMAGTAGFTVMVTFTVRLPRCSLTQSRIILTIIFATAGSMQIPIQLPHSTRIPFSGFLTIISFFGILTIIPFFHSSEKISDYQDLQMSIRCSSTEAAGDRLAQQPRPALAHRWPFIRWGSPYPYVIMTSHRLIHLQEMEFHQMLSDWGPW